MVIDRKIERYVREVMKYLPAGDRGLAQSEITEMLRDMVRDHAGDKEPDILDARAVIEELGSPEIMAMSWLEARHDFGEEDESALPITGWLSSVIPAIEKISWKKMNRAVSVMLMAFSVLAVFLVCFGIIALSTHMITTMLPVFLGCVLGLVAAAGRSVQVRQM